MPDHTIDPNETTATRLSTAPSALTGQSDRLPPRDPGLPGHGRTHRCAQREGLKAKKKVRWITTAHLTWGVT